MGMRESQRYGLCLAVISVLAATLLFCSTLCGQTTAPPTRTQTFHVHGRIRSSSGYDVDGAKVQFQSQKGSETVSSDNKGFYAADLPLGDYRMTVTSPVFRPIHRPLFRVESPNSYTFDFTLHPSPLMTDVPFPIDPSPALREAVLYDISPYGEDFFPVPSADGVPFVLYVRYASETLADQTHSYVGDFYPPYENRIFVAYNLFSMWADKVTYDEKNRIIEAHDNVCAVRESESLGCDYSMTFKIENGQAIRVR
jgi:hypothetical protein